VDQAIGGSGTPVIVIGHPSAVIRVCPGKQPKNRRVAALPRWFFAKHPRTCGNSDDAAEIVFKEIEICVVRYLCESSAKRL
jgi:hypothetical protein